MRPLSVHPGPARSRRRAVGMPVVTGVFLIAVLVTVGCTSDDPTDTGSPTEADGGLEQDAADGESQGSGPTEDDEAADVDEEPPEADEPEETDDQDEPAADPDLSVALTLTTVASLPAPIAGAVGPDGTFYLADRSGTVHPFVDGEVRSPVLDLSSETTTDSERGLLGLAFAADGSELYVSYTDGSGDSVVEAFAIEDGAVRADERRTILTLEQPYANHNGGDVQIGPDGNLYIGFGDGGAGGDPLGAGQDLGTWLGAILRIDPSAGDPYVVPDDNPFVGSDAREEIHVYGVRNPWRFSFDRETGDLWVADVGQNTREEINHLPADEVAGANLGWNLMEGTLEFGGAEPDDHVPPVHEYETGSRCSVTGGYVYRGTAIPELVGAYLFSDYCEAEVRAIVVRDGQVIEEAELGLGGSQHVSFAQDADGELYVLDLAGTVSRIDPVS